MAVTQPSTHPPGLAPKPSHTPSFTFSYSTSRHRRVRMSSETYLTGSMPSCAPSASAREPAPWHHQPRDRYLVHSHKQRVMRGAPIVSLSQLGCVSMSHSGYYHINRHVALRVTGPCVCIWDAVASGEVTSEASGRRKSET